jgi:hypothetical protein
LLGDVLLSVIVRLFPIMSNVADAVTGTAPGPVPEPVKVIGTASAGPAIPAAANSTNTAFRMDSISERLLFRARNPEISTPEQRLASVASSTRKNRSRLPKTLFLMEYVSLLRAEAPSCVKFFDRFNPYREPEPVADQVMGNSI